eukprot:CAMPEP_0170541044 /NCGR_PEP_ID=MMETSP0211-20121228/898_1 /TAXON_ID=311385 /ORGANISM="Pseudokeronopsis sp., Strain OXSARD2" /LENGTH=135 /DNA_ID=CAMNT_0010843645 /DNA_START=380 /DNA_END=787 /DNA_ORIENTATION=+
MLEAFIKNSFNLLKPGGQVIALHPRQPCEENDKLNVGKDLDAAENAKAPFVCSQPNFPPKDFDAYNIKYFVGEDRIAITYFTIFNDTIKAAFQKCGFSAFEFQRMEIDPQAGELYQWASSIPMEKQFIVRWTATK